MKGNNSGLPPRTSAGGFAIFAFGWAIANMLHGLASSWPALAFFRSLLGVREATIFPAGMKAISQWFPARERSVATGWINTGTSIGAMIAPPLVVWFIHKYNWQFAFVVTGGAALIWVALWLVLFRSPAEHPLLSQDEAEYIRAGQDAAQQSTAGKRPSWKKVLKQRRFWGIGIPHMLAEPTWQTFGAWIPLDMFTVRHMNLKEIALFAWMLFLAADLGCLVGGYLAPLFIRWFGCSLITACKLVINTGALLMISPACVWARREPIRRHRALLRQHLRAPDHFGHPVHARLVRLRPARSSHRHGPLRHARLPRRDGFLAYRRRNGKHDRL